MEQKRIKTRSRLVVEIDQDVKRLAHSKAASMEQPLRAIIEKLLREWLGGQNEPAHRGGEK